MKPELKHHSSTSLDTLKCMGKHLLLSQDLECMLEHLRSLGHCSVKSPQMSQVKRMMMIWRAQE